MISIANKKYIVFEGGGGKGNTYLGAIQALEEAKLFPLRPPLDGQTLQIEGVAGASAGAVTALMIALGLSKDDIEFESKRKLNRNKVFNGAGFEFFDLFRDDEPLPGNYRGVEIEQSGSVKIGFSFDKIDKTQDKRIKDAVNRRLKDSGNTGSILDELNRKKNSSDDTNTILDDLQRRSYKNLKNHNIDIGAGFSEIPKEKPDREVKKLYAAEYNLVVRPVGVLIRRWLENKLEDDPKNVLLAKVHSKLKEYLYNILYDRGLITGTKVRIYLTSLVERYLTKYHETAYSEFKNLNPNVTANQITFSQFKEITKIDLRISGTNMTQGENLIFSVNEKSSPHFPVVEAVGISMNIPGLFKPVRIHNKGAGNPVSGLWEDGGILNNLPFRAFATESGFHDDYVLGFNLTEGPDPIFFRDDDPYFLRRKGSNYEFPEYAQFIANYVREKQEAPPLKKPKKTGVISPGRPSFLGTSLFGVLGFLLNTWLDDATHSQLTPERIENNIIELYSYHIGTLDFTPDDNLLEFVKKKAYERTKERLGIT